MSKRTLDLLARPVRVRVILRYAGLITASMAVMTAILAAVAFYFDAAGAGARYAVVSIAALATGWTSSKLEDVGEDVQQNEALAITALAFLVAAAMLAWPFAASGAPGIDAWFEAVSAITTTGLSTLDGAQTLPAHLLFARSFAQWYGGLAILVLALGMLLSPGRAAKRLAATQIPGENLLASTRGRARDLFRLYLGLTAGAFTALWALGAAPFDALCHALSAVSTGGFSSLEDGAGALGGAATLVALSVGCLLGAVSFPLQLQAWRRGPKALFRDSELRALLWLCGIVAASLWATMTFLGGLEWGEAARHAPFLAVSAQTTTGFSTFDVARLDAASVSLLILAMFIGGDLGSTAGGIKIFRLLVLLGLVRRVFARTALPPHALVETKISGKTVEEEDGAATVAVVLLYSAAGFASWLPFLAYGLDPLRSLFDVASALGTVGLSTGVTAPDLPSPLKLILCVDMLMGRVEVVAFLTLFYSRSWIPGRKPQ